MSDAPPEDPRSQATLYSQAPEGALRTDPETLLSMLSQALTPREGGLRAAAPPVNVRLEDEGLLGQGGMGEVRRVRDHALHRSIALKAILPQLAGDPGWVTRFAEEAQITAQLDHPGVVPVHELGMLEDGRVFYTMKELHGRPLHQVIHEVHKASAGGQWRESPSGWTLRRLVDAVWRAAEAVSYAHSRGVIHRDLKPSNIMVGEFGEVLVLDWGLAKVLAGSSDAPLRTARTESELLETVPGAVAGTPAFMAPEQAHGEIDAIGPAADVHALGATLAWVLTGGAGEREGAALRLRGPLPIDEGLAGVCQRAMAWHIADRYPHAGDFAKALRRWLDGAHRRAQALAALERAQGLLPQVAEARAAAAALRQRAAEALEGLPTHAPTEEKRAGWAAEDAAAAAEREAELLELAYVRGVHAALSRDPELIEAKDALAEHHRARHAAAEAAGDALEAARQEAQLQAWDARGVHAEYLEGTGRLTLRTEPPVPARLRRYQLQERRLVAGPPEPLGSTPVVDRPLPMGSYLVELDAPCGPVRYPVHVPRQGHWVGESEGAGPLRLPRALGPDEVFVPEGPFLSGGDPEVLTGLPRERVHLPAFIIQRFSVTNADYLVFLNDLLERGREAEALRWAPRERAARGQDGALIYGRDTQGPFELVEDADGDRWDPRWPVCMVDWFCAEAYAAWRAERDGLPWRLPTEGEWEKAARGVDGRCFPWGDFIDPTWACCRDSHKGGPLPSPVDGFPLDESPYGVRGMAGNMRDWCGLPRDPTSPWAREGSAVYGEAARVFKGGSWDYPPQNTRSAFRYWSVGTLRAVNVGFRLARDV